MSLHTDAVAQNRSARIGAGGIDSDDANLLSRSPVVGGEAIDVFFDGHRIVELPGERHPDRAAHGSGCTHSSVLAARLAWGDEPLEAARVAKQRAAAAVKKMPGVTVIEQEKVPETVEVQKAMASMIEQDGGQSHRCRECRAEDRAPVEPHACSRSLRE